MKNHLKRKYISLLLILSFIFSILPPATLAKENLSVEGASSSVINVNVIVALDDYDGWQILSPKDDRTTQVAVYYEGDNPTVLDVVKTIDPDFDGTLTNNKPTKFLGYERGKDGYGNWAARRVRDDSYTVISDFTEKGIIEEHDSIIIYLAFQNNFDGPPTWEEVEHFIDNPVQSKTPEERLNELIDNECSWDKIKGSNIKENEVTKDLKLPSSSSDYAISFSWSVEENPYMSIVGTEGKVKLRPAFGEEAATVKLILSVKNYLMPNTDKYGDYPENTEVKTYELTILPYSEDETTQNTASVKAALDEIKLEHLTLMDKEEMDPDNVLYDIQLVDPRDFGDKSVDYISEPWSSSNPDVIKINYMRGKVIRPSIGEPDEEVTLTVTASKGGASDTKSFTVTVKAVTQGELDTANAELNAVKDALTFDVIKKDNISADAVTSDLQMVYRDLGYPDSIRWETSNRGEKGIKIEWETSDDAVVKSYGTVSRPSTADKPAVLTATLSPFRLAEYIEPCTVEIPLVVRKISRSANVDSITLLLTLGFSFDSEQYDYDISVPAIVDELKIDVVTEETGTFIISGESEGRGKLSFNKSLTSGKNTVQIITKALDSEDTKTYTLNITRDSSDGTDGEILAIIQTLSEKYKNTSSDWESISMSALGKGSEVAGLGIVNNCRDVYEDGSTTDLARSIITLTALGVDAANVYSGNEGVYLNFIEKIGENEPSQIMDAIFGLIALDSGDYNDEGLILNRESCIDFILDKGVNTANGGFGWFSWGDTPDIDTTAMALTALSPYYDKNEDIRTAVDCGLKFLSSKQNDSGDFGSTDSTSTVIVALSALGIDPADKNGDFARKGNSPIDGLLTFKTDSNEFGLGDNETGNSMSTEQGFRALVAYRGFLASNGKYNIYYFGPQTGDGTELTGETDPGTLPLDPDTPKNITVRIEDLFNGKTLMPETKVKVSGTHLDALKKALEVNGKDPDTELIETSGFVTSILGVSAGDTTGWMYAVNGEIPNGLNLSKVEEGDSLILFYGNWFDVYFTIFDETFVNIKEGESITLKLTGLNPMDAMDGAGEYLPIPDARVFAYDSSGNRVGADATTDINGMATLTFLEPGIYTVSASKSGSVNKTSLVPPLCEVTVDPISNPEPDPEGITAYFTLRGLNEKTSKEETWINNKKVTDIYEDATVADIIVKALEGTGYSQKGAQNGYIRSVTTPKGFTLEEMHDGMPNSGWLYKINSKLPTVGMDSQLVRDGDRILLYFTKDFTKDPDAGSVSGKDEEAVEKGLDIKIKTKVKDNVATGVVDTNEIKNALDEIVGFSEPDLRKEIVVQIEDTERVSVIKLDMKGDAIRALSKEKNINLIIENKIARLSFDQKALSAISQDIHDNSNVDFTIKSIDTSKTDQEIKKIIGDFPAFEFNVRVDEKEIHEFKGSVSVFLPYTSTDKIDPDTLTVYYLDEQGNSTLMEDARFDAKLGGYTFTTTHFSLFYIGALEEKWVNQFSDVKEEDWFYEAVKYMNKSGLMEGTSMGKFSPDIPMTRGMVATVLYRCEEEPLVKYTDSFTDVGENHWYTDGILWAQQNNIASGYGNRLFGPDDNITREQLSVILKNYLQWKGHDISERRDISNYNDAKDVSTWALDSMKWANAVGLMEGKTKKTLAPKENATRAETATMLYRLYSNIFKQL